MRHLATIVLLLVVTTAFGQGVDRRDRYEAVGGKYAYDGWKNKGCDIGSVDCINGKQQGTAADLHIDGLTYINEMTKTLVNGKMVQMAEDITLHPKARVAYDPGDLDNIWLTDCHVWDGKKWQIRPNRLKLKNPRPPEVAKVPQPQVCVSNFRFVRRADSGGHMYAIMHDINGCNPDYQEDLGLLPVTPQVEQVHCDTCPIVRQIASEATAGYRFYGSYLDDWKQHPIKNGIKDAMAGVEGYFLGRHNGYGGAYSVLTSVGTAEASTWVYHAIHPSENQATFEVLVEGRGTEKYLVKRGKEINIGFATLKIDRKSGEVILMVLDQRYKNCAFDLEGLDTSNPFLPIPNPQLFFDNRGGTPTTGNSKVTTRGNGPNRDAIPTGTIRSDGTAQVDFIPPRASINTGVVPGTVVNVGTSTRSTVSRTDRVQITPNPIIK